MERRPQTIETAILGGMEFSIELISPELSAEYLLRNIDVNRPMSEGLIDNYSRDMGASIWHLTHQGIAFDTMGRLIDGQQRLNAIIRSGKSQKMLVVRGVPPETFAVLDTGRSRSVAHSLKMAGIAEISARKLSIARRMILGLNNSNKTFTRQEHMTLYCKHQRAIEFAHDSLSNDYNVAPVGAVVARAWCTPGYRQRLLDFGKVVSDGNMKTEGDHAAVQLRTLIDRSRTDSKTGKKQVEIYARSEYALIHFLEQRRPSTLRAVKDEQFPI